VKSGVLASHKVPASHKSSRHGFMYVLRMYVRRMHASSGGLHMTSDRILAISAAERPIGQLGVHAVLYSYRDSRAKSTPRTVPSLSSHNMGLCWAIKNCRAGCDSYDAGLVRVRVTDGGTAWGRVMEGMEIINNIRYALGCACTGAGLVGVCLLCGESCRCETSRVNK
jgi:hypothetical protein